MTDAWLHPWEAYPPPLLYGMFVVVGLAALAAIGPADAASEYWAPAVPNGNGGGMSTNQFVLHNWATAGAPISVDVWCAGVSAATYSIPAGGVVSHNMPSAIWGSALTSSATCRATSTSDSLSAMLFADVVPSNSDDASQVLLASRLGQEYWVDTEWAGSSFSFFSVVATQPGTVVQITPSVPTRSGPGMPALAAVTWTSGTLSAFQTLHISASGDLTGSHVVANKPVAVFAGHPCLSLGIFAGCDHASDQLIPTEEADARYVACSSGPARSGAPARDRIEIIATAPNTVVTLTPPPPPPGLATFVLPTIGSRRTVIVDQDTLVESNGPKIHVTQFYDDGGSAGSGRTGDAAMIAHIPTTKYRYAHDLYAPAGINWYVSVAMAAGGTATVGTGPGTTVTPWRPVGTSNFVWGPSRSRREHTR